MNNLYLIFFVFIYQSVFSQIDNKAFQLEFLKVLNDYRIENGLNPVKVNVDVQSAAKIQSDYIVSTFYNYKDSSLRGNTGHYNPNYPNPNDRLESINFNLAESSNVSENVFYFTGGSLNSKSIVEYVKLTFESWKKSPSHNKNLLNPPSPTKMPQSDSTSNLGLSVLDQSTSGGQGSVANMYDLRDMTS
jgi:uncharacterized protein YkwD